MPFPGFSVFTVCTILRFGLGTLCGFLALLIGHVVLRAADSTSFDYNEYTLESSMKAGALGGTLMYLPAQALEYLIKKAGEPWVGADGDEEAATCACATEGCSCKGCGCRRKSSPLTRLFVLFLQSILYLGTAVAFGAGTGVIGTAILRDAQSDDFLPPLYATYAGSIGGAIIGPALVAVILLLTACCGGVLGGIIFLSKRKDSRLDTDAPSATGATETITSERKPETK
jgi:hypothetical protein